jgi:hypothetical protein
MIIDKVRTGSWLTPSRVRAYPVIFLFFYVVSVIWWSLAGHSPLDESSFPLGADFINVYAASELMLQGAPEAAYDLQRHYEVQHELVAFDEDSYFGWHYPPMALLFVAPLAKLPYLAALGVWLGIGLCFYLMVIRRSYPGAFGPVALVALGFTGIIVNVAHGQNGLLTTALFGAAFLLLDRDRPWLAGVVIALMLYKPQFGVLIPVALVAGLHWRTFIAAAAVGLLLIGFSYAVLGKETWLAFLESTRFTRTVVLETGNTGWHRIESIFSMLRMQGGSVGLAYGVQGLAILLLGVLVYRFWRRPETPLLIKASFLAAASLLATPYVFDYDMNVIALPMVWMVADALKRGFLPWEKSFLALLWLWPLASRMLAEPLHFQFTPLVLAALLYAIHRRAGVIQPEENLGHAREI